MNNLSFKEGVEITRVHPKIVRAWYVFAQLGSEVGINTVVTSVSDGVHREGSKHYKDPCQASDFRTWYIEAPELFAGVLRDRLGEGYDVVVEKTHIHVEWDPK